MARAKLLNSLNMLQKVHRTPLSGAPCGARCVVRRVAAGSAETRGRLYALGIVPGAAVDVLRLAPLGDPMQIRVGGSLIGIRRSDAADIQVDIQ